MHGLNVFQKKKARDVAWRNFACLSFAKQGFSLFLGRGLIIFEVRLYGNFPNALVISLRSTLTSFHKSQDLDSTVEFIKNVSFLSDRFGLALFLSKTSY